MLPLMLLCLLLLPSFAQAQAPVIWSVVASTCTPDDTALPMLRINSHYVSVQPGALTSAPQPLRVRCPIHLTGRWRVDALEATVRDPDGQGRASRLLVDVKRLDPAIGGGVQPLHVAQLDTSRVLIGTGDQPVGVMLFPTVLDFGQDTYWIEVSVLRTSALVLPPRVYTIRLRGVPDFTLE